MVIALQDHVLTWYVKYCTDNSLVSLADTQAALNKEFGKPKSDSLSIIGFKEMTMRPSETPWDLDQRLKCVIYEANMHLIDS